MFLLPLLLPLSILFSVTFCFTPPGARCNHTLIPLLITSQNRLWTGPRWSDNYGFMDFLSTIASFGRSADFPLPVGNPETQTASYEIYATFCAPEMMGGKRSKTVLLATHGIGFDGRYWNSRYEPERYNFVQYAVNRGYSVFFYDRLGVGSSTKVSGYDNQLSIEIAVLSSLAKSVSQGTYTTIGKPTHLVLIGHSYGSFISNALVASEPTIADAAVLTGYGLNGSNIQVLFEAFAPRVARLQQPRAFSAFDSGYLTTADIFGTVQVFFKAGAYDCGAAAFVESIKQPFAINEAVSVSPGFLNNDAPNFKGPTLAISGEFDFPLYVGNYPGVLDQPLRTLFRGSSDFQSYVQPKTGHVLNFATNATGSYAVIFDFLLKHQL